MLSGLDADKLTVCRHLRQYLRLLILGQVPLAMYISNDEPVDEVRV